MRTVLTLLAPIVVVAGCVAGAPLQQAAPPSSGQGGYLGLDVGAHLRNAEAIQPLEGSHQGGYLGLNAGATLKPMVMMTGDMRASPMMFCQTSVEPGRCRSRALSDHAYCMERNPDRYAVCRRAMDYIGWHN